MDVWDSIFDSFVASPWQEEDEEEREARRLRHAMKDLSFRGNVSSKDQILAMLRETINVGGWDESQFYIDAMDSLFPVSLPHLAKMHNIPHLLVRVMMEIAELMATSHTYNNKKAADALEWLHDTFASIPVGVDLTLIGYRFIKTCVDLTWPSKKSTISAAPDDPYKQGLKFAFDVVDARARGVFVPARFSEAAANFVWDGAEEPELIECVRLEDEFLDQRALSCAVSTDPQKLASTVKFAIFHGFNTRDYGDPNLVFIAERFGDRLVKEIAEAPPVKELVIRFQLPERSDRHSLLIEALPDSRIG